VVFVRNEISHDGGDFFKLDINHLYNVKVMDIIRQTLNMIC
jgi:hypothetical protein